MCFGLNDCVSLYMCCTEENISLCFCWCGERRLEANRYSEESLKMLEPRVQVVF